MRSAVVQAPFPSTLLVLRIGRFVLLVPWVFVWAIAAVLMPMCWAAGLRAGGAEDDSRRKLLRNWHVVVLLLVMMRGTVISVRGHGYRVYLRWL